MTVVDSERAARFSQPKTRSPDVVIDLLVRAPSRRSLGGARVHRGRHDQPLAGIFLCLLGLASFAGQDVLIKILSDSYSIWQLAFVRAIVVLTIMTPIVMISLGRPGFLTRRLGVHLARGLLAVTSYTSYYLAVAGMPLVDAAALYASAPLFVTLFSVLFLRETVGWRRTGAVLVGFAGVLVMLRPGADVFQPLALLSLLSAALYAYSTTVTRSLGRTDGATTITIYSNLVYLLVSSLILLGLQFFDPLEPSSGTTRAFLTRPWHTPPLSEFGVMIGSGMLATSGFFCLAKAYSVSPVSQVAPFEFSYLLWGLLFGFAVWGHVPSAWTGLGAVIVIAASIYIIKRESMLTRKILNRPTDPNPTAKVATGTRRGL